MLLIVDMVEKKDVPTMELNPKKPAALKEESSRPTVAGLKFVVNLKSPTPANVINVLGESFSKRVPAAVVTSKGEEIVEIIFND